MKGDSSAIFRRWGRLAAACALAASLFSCVAFTNAINEAIAGSGGDGTGSESSGTAGSADAAATSGSGAGAATSWDSPELSAALAPLYEKHIEFAVPDTPVAGLPADADPDVALALRTLNTYRRAADLPLYRYDPSLTEMAMKHARFFTSNCGRAPMAHYEPRNLPGYSAAGNAAASTSGLAFGVSGPMEAMSELMSGAYHRLQFLVPADTRIGVGYAASPDGKCSIGLFVTRPFGSDAPAARTGSRVVLFPAPDATGVPTEFMHGENPDPRPGITRLPDGSTPVTGYPITLSFSHQMSGSFRSSSVTVTDSTGKPVDAWVTDPARPSTTLAPNIYGPGVSQDWAFRTNFDAVFIMPKEPLESGERYSVDAKLDFGGKTTTYQWSFTTEAPRTWKVRPDGRYPWTRLGSVLAMASAGDAIELAPGNYPITDLVHLADVRILGAGASSTHLLIRTHSQYSPIEIKGPCALEALTIDGPSNLIYASSGTTLLMRDVALRGGDGETAAISAEPGSTFILEDLDTSSFHAYYPFYSMDRSQAAGGRQASSPGSSGGSARAQGPPRLYVYHVRLTFGSGGLVYGKAAVRRIPHPLKLPDGT